ncbi:MAG TPA: RNA 2',3'-cyclic phosphodiesterase [Rubrobacteraceae bacterium]|nr:RNA 2',3'-cyclic phosphodiesterase [Rubrobacteraceae bacterium]
MAVFPPPEVRRIALESARSRARDLGDRVRWTRPEYVHLTLKFLGEVPEVESDQIGAALRKVCADHAPFDASLSSFGAFPSARRARVIWAGTGVGSEELRALAADVEAAFEPLGFGKEDRTFVPHATLGRVRGKPVKLELPAVVPGEPGFGISRVELMESKLAAGGAVYESVHSLALRSG